MSTMRATRQLLRTHPKSSTLQSSPGLLPPPRYPAISHQPQSIRRQKATAVSRDDLTSRVLPTYNLSPATSPLTAPFKPSATDTSPSRRAAERFAVHGNAIVTGGAGDLGFAACRALLEHGATGLTIFDLDPVVMASRVAALEAEFPHARIGFARVDVTDEAGLQHHVAATAAAQGEGDGDGMVDTLLAFAGVASCMHAADLPVGEWRRILDINTTGAFLCAQAVANAAIRARRPASIVLTASISAHRVNFPQPQAAYNASKAAVKHLGSSLAAEWARYGVRVNTISPGYMDTILNEGEGLRRAREQWNGRNTMGRMGDPEELTGAVVLLASRAGSYINGADIVVDGGQTLLM